jgi:spoIIIJ-associated protein
MDTAETLPSNLSPQNPDDPRHDQTQEGSATPSEPMDMNALSKEAEEILGTMLPLLSFEAKLTTTLEKSTVRIRMQCEDAGRLIGRRGSTVNEIQFLLNRILQRRHKSVPRIFLDVDGPREVKPEIPAEADPETITKAQTAVDQVRRWGDPVELGSIDALNRKAIQDMYAKDKELEVIVSEKGDLSGPQKVRIQLKQK